MPMGYFLRKNEPRFSKTIRGNQGRDCRLYPVRLSDIERIVEKLAVEMKTGL